MCDCDNVCVFYTRYVQLYLVRAIVTTCNCDNVCLFFLRHTTRNAVLPLFVPCTPTECVVDQVRAIVITCALVRFFLTTYNTLCGAAPI